MLFLKLPSLIKIISLTNAMNFGQYSNDIIKNYQKNLFRYRLQRRSL